LPVVDWRLPIGESTIARLTIDGLTIERLAIARLPIDGLMIARLPIALQSANDFGAGRRLIRGLGNQQSTIHSTIDNRFANRQSVNRQSPIANRFDNRQSVDPQSPIDNPPIGSRQSPNGNG